MGTPNPWPIHFTDVQQLDYLLYGSVWMYPRGSFTPPKPTIGT